MGDARLIHERGSVPVGAAGSALQSGQIVQLDDGRAAYVEGLKGVDSGMPYSARTDGIVEVPTVVAITAGQKVDWDATGRTAVVSGGDYTLGLAVRDATATSVWVELNEPVPANATP